jgi:choline dehydrogenase-like flavoprotein
VQTSPRARYPISSTVDFVVVGSGAAGGIIAKELSTAGFSVVVLEQGPRLEPTQFEHDEFKYSFRNHLLTKSPVTWRETAAEQAKVKSGAMHYARMVGGSSVHYTANLWRLRPVDFNEASRLGGVSGTTFTDWPITYEELEPYYAKVDWEIGVSGAPGPFDPPRSRPYPMPPLPIKSAGVLFERAARTLGLHPQPAPMGILSQPHNGRVPCQQCGFCMGFGCEFGAKSSSLSAMIPVAERTGRCEVRPDSYVRKVQTNDRGRVTGVIYFDAQRREQLQRARAVVLCANGAESARLLLMSAGPRFPHGLANSSGIVGQNLMLNGISITPAIFEHPLNEYKGVQVTRIALDYYDSDPKRGFYGGGGLDARGDITSLPIAFTMYGPAPGAPTWGAEFKRSLRHDFVRQMVVLGHTTSLPLATNNITLDPTLKDDWGLPAIRVTYRDHPDDLATARFLGTHAERIVQAAGAKRYFTLPVEVQKEAFHLLGTCRMGNDPRTSVVNRDHRAHDVPNLFVCDGSSMVTSSRGQPTMTIMALAFRAGEQIARMAKAGEV